MLWSALETGMMHAIYIEINLMTSNPPWQSGPERDNHVVCACFVGLECACNFYVNQSIVSVTMSISLYLYL